MSYNDYQSNKEYYRKKILEGKLRLERAKILNAEYDKIYARKTEIEGVLNSLLEYINLLNDTKDEVQKEDSDFKTRRIEYLNDIITERLSQFFPNDGLICKLAFDDKYKSSNATLRLEDANGFLRKPQISEGKLCQYLISFIASDSVVRSLGKNIIYIDEAFGVASTKKLEDVGRLIAQSVQDGIQIILVSQRSELYAEIPHREIVMHKDEILDQVVIDEIKDY